MAASKKKTTKRITGYNKETSRERTDDSMSPIWDFGNIDNDGCFALNTKTRSINTGLLLEKLISYSSMSWTQIKTMTHDEKNKTKNHYLDYMGISDEGRKRIKVKQISEENYELIFSFALDNKTRLIGLKNGRIFQAIWYDSEHSFYPVKN